MFDIHDRIAYKVEIQIIFDSVHCTLSVQYRLKGALVVRFLFY